MKEAVHDPGYLKFLRTERCLFTGQMATPDVSVVAHHAGHDKHRDDHALPMNALEHNRLHHMGEVPYLREHAPRDLILAMWRALAEKMYAKRKREREAA